MEFSDHFAPSDLTSPIHVKEAKAVLNAILAVSELVRDSRVIAKVDNKAVVDSWTLSGGVAGDLNNILKELFLAVVKLNIWFNMI